MQQNRYDLDWPMSRVRFIRDSGTELGLGYIVWPAHKGSYYANQDANKRMIAGMSDAAPLDIAKPDNPADMTITLRISGNRLVSVCNALQQMMHETNRMTRKGDSWEFLSSSYRDINETIERIRDELSAQRMSGDRSYCN